MPPPTVTFALNRLGRVEQDADAATDTYVDTVQQVRNDGDLSGDARQRRENEAREVVAAALDELAGRIVEDRTTVSQWADETLRNPDDDSQAAVLHELQEQRAWDRARLRLEGGTHPETLVREAEGARDTQTLSALYAELPSYLTATSGRGHGLREQPADRDNVTYDGWTLRLRQALIDTLDDGPRRDALDAQRQLDQLVPVAEAAVTTARRVIADPLGSSFGRALTRRAARNQAGAS